MHYFHRLILYRYYNLHDVGDEACPHFFNDSIFFSNLSEYDSRVSSIAPTSTAPAAIPVGGCACFAIEAGTAISFDGVTSYIYSGSVGIFPNTAAAVTGSYKVIDLTCSHATLI